MIYCLFNPENTPDWFAPFKKLVDKSITIYDPTRPLVEQEELVKRLPQLPVSYNAENQHKALRINPVALQSTAEALEQLLRAEHGSLRSQEIFSHHFLLVRARVVLVDLNKTWPQTSHLLHTAYQLEIPSVGISHIKRTAHWDVHCCNRVLAPNDACDIYDGIKDFYTKGE